MWIATRSLPGLQVSVPLLHVLWDQALALQRLQQLQAAQIRGRRHMVEKQLRALQARIDSAGLQQRIRLPGYQIAMQPWWQQLDALVISSRTEGTPMILLEAMQDGVPVVAFGVGGIPDVIEHGRSGLLAPPLAVDELAAQLEALMLDPAQAGELIAQARRTQRERYHLPTLAQRWAQVYRGTAGAAKETCA